MNPKTPEPPAPLWTHGWYRFARQHKSPNYGPRPKGARTDLVVVHSISLPPGKYGGDEVQALFDNTLNWSAHPYFESIRGLQVSAHFYIRRQGELWQFVSADDRAWHAGTSHYRGRSNCNDDSIGIELEGLEGEPFEPEQYDTLVSLLAALVPTYPIRHIAGHEHIAPGRKFDPGAGFRWQAVQSGTGWDARCFPSLVQK
ncbi:MAG: 1,6-anhydro-N-acetylmuramyl-L-alanine amidase AmpD [Ferruginibacter sp.]|nr:1,6-anhydro-N-acetylmuramyl-L-alanine amidase AmpD [Rhodoferax sp.]